MRKYDKKNKRNIALNSNFAEMKINEEKYLRNNYTAEIVYKSIINI